MRVAKNSFIYFCSIVLLVPAVLKADPVSHNQSSPRSLVVWDGGVIDELDFEVAMRRIPDKDRMEFRRSLRRVMSVLDDVHVNRVLAAEAVRDGVLDSTEALRAVELARESVLARYRLDRLRQQAPVGDALEQAALEFYKLNESSYLIPERVRVQHILIGIKDRDEDEAQKIAGQVREEALRDGSDFEALAIRYSDDPSVNRNKGDLGFFTKGKMVKEFEDVAFSLLSEGEISPVVRTRFGFHVIRMMKREPESQRTFEHVRQSIINRIRDGQIDEYLQNYIAVIRADPSIKIEDDLVRGLVAPSPVTVQNQPQ